MHVVKQQAGNTPVVVVCSSQLSAQTLLHIWNCEMMWLCLYNGLQLLQLPQSCQLHVGAKADVEGPGSILKRQACRRGLTIRMAEDEVVLV